MTKQTKFSQIGLIGCFGIIALIVILLATPLYAPSTYGRYVYDQGTEITTNIELR